MLQNHHAHKKKLFFKKAVSICQPRQGFSDSFFAFLYGKAYPRRAGDVSESHHEYVQKSVL
jgi:hypothetical protein